MNQSRFTLNAFLLVVAIMSALTFAITLILPSMADWSAINDFYRIEETDYAIVYSDIKPNGIYEGPEQTAVLRVEGTFGHDWGIVLDEPYLYANEYTSTQMGLMHCSLVRIDLRTFEKETILEDAVLRGRCQSGELVCVAGFLMPSTFPETNSLCRLYAMTTPGIAPWRSGMQVVFLDPSTAEAVGSVSDSNVPDEVFEERYINRTLADILEEVEA